MIQTIRTSVIKIYTDGACSGNPGPGALGIVVLDENNQEVMDIGAHRKGILEELEKAHIYIEQLNERIKVLEEKLKELT